MRRLLITSLLAVVIGVLALLAAAWPTSTGAIPTRWTTTGIGTAVAGWSADGTRLYMLGAASEGWQAPALIDVATGEWIAREDAGPTDDLTHTDPATIPETPLRRWSEDVAFDPTTGKFVSLLDEQNGQTSATLPPGATNVALSGTGWIAAVSHSFAPGTTLVHRSDQTLTLAYFADETNPLTSPPDKVFKETHTSHLLGPVLIGRGHPLKTVSFSPDGTLLAVVESWDILDPAPHATVRLVELDSLRDE